MPRRIVTAVAGLLLAVAIEARAARGPLAPGDYDLSVVVAGRTRTYLLHVPPQAAEGRPLPLLLAFHGGGGNAEGMKAAYGLDRIADREGYLVAYPDGSGPLRRRLLTWNAGGCCAYAMRRNVDDVAFARAVIDDLAARVAVDARRVFAAGHSNGAMLCHRLAVEMGDRIAAIAAVAGSMVLEAPDPATPAPVPVMVIHSVDDPRAIYAGGLGPPSFGGERSRHAPVEETVRRWVERNGCDPVPEVGPVIRGRDAGVTAQRFTYRGGRGGAQVVFWRLTGTGHAWPGQRRQLPERVMGPYAAAIDADEEILAFFGRFPR